MGADALRGAGRRCEVIIYLAARLAAFMYGLDWPLARVNGLLAIWSALTIPFEVFAAIMLLKQAFSEKRKGGAE